MSPLRELPPSSLAPAPDARQPQLVRKSLGLTQVRLAALMEVAQETISRRETGSEYMSRVSRLALLAIGCAAGSLDRLAKNEPARVAEVLHVRAA